MPIGLGLSAQQRGFTVRVFLNTDQVLFLDGVRSDMKKEIMSTVHRQFVDQAKATNVELVYQDLSQDMLVNLIEDGYAVLILISTYQLDGKKAPHWVCVTGIDEHCLYVHDPDFDSIKELALDCQYLPIARSDFDKMSVFGSSRLRTAVVIKRTE